MGSGGAFLDIDDDGDLDLYLVNGREWPSYAAAATSASALYRNDGHGAFTDTTDSAGVLNEGSYGHGAACGDYDNDGDVDLYVTNFGANRLYRNDGRGAFTDVTDKAGVGDPRWSASAAFVDVDRDGDLDLYVVNYVQYEVDTPHPPCADAGVRGYCHPKHFDGARDRLYRNNGDGTFADATESAGISDPGGPFQGKGLGVVAADFDDDGWPDIYVANDDTPNYLFYNRRDGTFSEIAVLAGCAYSADGIAQAGMGVDAADYDGDGRTDVFVTNFSHETNTLYRNAGVGAFTDASYRARLGEQSYLLLGFGTGFLDYDSDGHLDLFVANGHIFENVERGTDVLTYAQRNQLFHNDGDGGYSETAFHEHVGVSRGAIFGDYDNDGDTDLLVTNLGGAPQLLRNDSGPGRNWLRLRVLDSAAGRDAIGAKVVLRLGGRTQTREVRTAYSYLCSNDPRVLFGLGDQTQADEIRIRWPNGDARTLRDVPANREVVLSQDGIVEGDLPSGR
ncbi:CRTAC1 family protein [Candidatus Poribacteria bacterium]|nr:CRTAC1 family protein [Candidatus Poribacteria bacterium]MBT5710478.1 CRTAC1 family protein [Candidatus Poribacteria bacterium]MBT7100455.1 CRTAC1 family protein [Candidatus Poribacteria bacterium]MBT7804934.1 CRTAC1 family protein [Candidatus Poribacteria bacterium]